MMDEEILKIAVQIIFNAGNARKLATDAMRLMGDKNFTEARMRLEEADVEIGLAHASQSKLLQEEAGGQNIQTNLIMSHAQDTLMIAMSERKGSEEIHNSLAAKK